MFVSSGGRLLQQELSFLKKTINSRELKRLLGEDSIGYPSLVKSGLRSSHNSIHHLFHLLKYIDETQTNLTQTNTVVEWGGGYGNLAKIFIRLTKTKPTYIIIDTPLLSCLQWLYLATIFGTETVNLIKSPEEKIIENKINLIPISLITHFDINADLFISTWALSESSASAQDYVVQKNWFNAKKLLLAYQATSEFWPSAGRLGELAEQKGAKIEEIENLPKNYYAFL